MRVFKLYLQTGKTRTFFGETQVARITKRFLWFVFFGLLSETIFYAFLGGG